MKGLSAGTATTMRAALALFEATPEAYREKGRLAPPDQAYFRDSREKRYGIWEPHTWSDYERRVRDVSEYTLAVPAPNMRVAYAAARHVSELGAAGFEPALAAFSTPCLFQLGYATVDLTWHPWPDSHRLGLA